MTMYSIRPELDLTPKEWASWFWLFIRVRADLACKRPTNLVRAEMKMTCVVPDHVDETRWHQMIDDVCTQANNFQDEIKRPRTTLADKFHLVKDFTGLSNGEDRS